jgi:uncharacterized protein (DUF488 family)
MDRVLTIGVYGWTAARWRAALVQAHCDVLIDIRARRGVRGPDYAFANRARLEALLEDEGIGYLYLPELAPPRQVRDAQIAADHATATRKRDRTELAESFTQQYVDLVADRFDWAALAARIDDQTPALLCVERLPAACHRSIAAERLARAAGASREDLLP